MFLRGKAGQALLEDIEGALWQYMTGLGVRTLCNPMHRRHYDSRYMHCLYDISFRRWNSS